VLAAGAEAEVATADDEVAAPYGGGERGVGVLHDVLGQLRQVAAQMVQAAGRDVVGGDVVPERPRLAAQHGAGHSLFPTAQR